MSQLSNQFPKIRASSLAIVVSGLLTSTTIFAKDTIHAENTYQKQSLETISSGSWNNAAEKKANGLFTIQITRIKNKIEGTAEYNFYNKSQRSGLLSVNGYAKGNIAYLRFRDGRGLAIADGKLTIKNNVLMFTQTTESFFLPKSAHVQPF